MALSTVQQDTFGHALRAFRGSAGLTQEELAERAGLSTNGVSALERGIRTNPSPNTVRALAEALGLAPEDRDRLLELARGGGAPAPAGPPAPLPPASASAALGSPT